MKKALLILCIFVLPAFGQSTNITGIPSGVTIFEIQMSPGKGPNGADTVYGAIRLDGAYLDSEYPADPSRLPTSLPVVSDDPESPGELNLPTRHIVTAIPEPPHQREIRYNKANFSVVTGAGDAKMLVHDDTKAKVDRLRELESLRESKLTALLASVEVAPTASEDVVEHPGLISLWGGHLAVVVIAGLALAIIVKVCF